MMKIKCFMKTLATKRYFQDCSNIYKLANHEGVIKSIRVEILKILDEFDVGLNFKAQNSKSRLRRPSSYYCRRN